MWERFPCCWSDVLNYSALPSFLSEVLANSSSPFLAVPLFLAEENAEDYAIPELGVSVSADVYVTEFGQLRGKIVLVPDKPAETSERDRPQAKVEFKIYDRPHLCRNMRDVYKGYSGVIGPVDVQLENKTLDIMDYLPEDANSPTHRFSSGLYVLQMKLTVGNQSLFTDHLFSAYLGKSQAFDRQLGESAFCVIFNTHAYQNVNVHSSLHF